MQRVPQARYWKPQHQQRSLCSPRTAAFHVQREKALKPWSTMTIGYLGREKWLVLETSLRQDPLRSHSPTMPAADELTSQSWPCRPREPSVPPGFCHFATSPVRYRPSMTAPRSPPMPLGRRQGGRLAAGQVLPLVQVLCRGLAEKNQWGPSQEDAPPHRRVCPRADAGPPAARHTVPTSARSAAPRAVGPAPRAEDL